MFISKLTHSVQSCTGPHRTPGLQPGPLWTAMYNIWLCTVSDRASQKALLGLCILPFPVLPNNIEHQRYKQITDKIDYIVLTNTIANTSNPAPGNTKNDVEQTLLVEHYLQVIMPYLQAALAINLEAL